MPEIGAEFLKQLHFDPINAVIVAGAALLIYTLLNREQRWHSKWIIRHDQECDENRKTNNKLFAEMQSMNAHLATLTEGHEKRIDRLETQSDRARAR
jgi:hypothetical protein